MNKIKETLKYFYNYIKRRKTIMSYGDNMTEAKKVELMHVGTVKIISYMSKEQRAAFDDIFYENYNLYYLEVEKKNKDFALADCGYVSLAMFFKTIPQEEKTALLEKFKYEELKG